MARRGAAAKAAKKKGPYVIVRGKNVGVHAGVLVSDKRDRLVLTDSRRIWYWRGAASLSGLAAHGPSAPQDCKFGEPLEKQELRGLDTMGDYEVIHCTPKGEAAIRAVVPWKA